MKIDGLLEVIQVQRHDFLNHLQVISGLLQLNKGERVKDYINQVCGQYEKLSRLTRIASPEVKAVLLIAGYTASKKQVELLFDIQTSMESLGVPGDVAGEALERCITNALKYLSPPEISNRFMALTISEGEKKITIKIEFTVMSAEVIRDFKDQMDLSDWLAPFNSTSKLAVTEKKAEIYLVFPKK